MFFIQMPVAHIMLAKIAPAIKPESEEAMCLPILNLNLRVSCEMNSLNRLYIRFDYSISEFLGSFLFSFHFAAWF